MSSLEDKNKSSGILENKMLMLLENKTYDDNFSWDLHSFQWNNSQFELKHP